MRIGGLATGMDIDQLVNKLMEAERAPLNKLQQDKQKVEWQRDTIREINLKLEELKNLVKNPRPSTFRQKKIASSQENNVSAVAKTGLAQGNYQVKVTALATSAMNVSTSALDVTDSKAALGISGEFSFYTFNEAGEKETHKVNVSADDSLSSILWNISTDKSNNVRAFYDTQQKKVIMETTRTGNYNTTSQFGGAEIGFDNDNTLFTDVFKFDKASEVGGTNATFTYNGSLELESKNNSYSLFEGDLELIFHNVTDGNAKLSVTNDVDAIADNIMKIVDKYNEVIELLNKTQTEERFRDFPPLTDAQKEEMTEEQIKKWEEKAKSGLLKGDTLLTNSMYSLRRDWYEKVDTGGAFNALTQIGLGTSPNYRDGGKIVLKDGTSEKLKEALNKDLDSVINLFMGNSENGSKGILKNLSESVEKSQKGIDKRAGRSSDALEIYSMGRQLKDFNNRITAFEKRLVQVESRYWRQFTAMEKAIQRFNMQSAQMMQQFGGMQ